MFLGHNFFKIPNVEWWTAPLHVMILISWDMAWEVMPDLFFYHNPEEVEKEKQAQEEATAVSK